MKFPEWLATTDLDSPDLKRSKNRLESAGLPLGFGFLEALFRTFKGQRAIAKATKWIPENEKSQAFIDRQNVLKNEKLSNDPVEDVILKAAEREEQQLDALGLQGISRQVDPSKPIKGVHDAFEMGELGTITAPTLSQAVMDGMTDVARIYNNKGTIQGRVGSVFTEAALGMLDFNARTQRLMVKTVSKIMNEADKFAAEIPEVGKLTAKQIDEAGEWIAAKAIDPAMGVEELREFFQPFKAGNTKDSVAYISDVGYVGAMKTIKKLGEDLYNMDVAKARGLIDASFAGQVADMAGVAVEYSDDVLVERAQELIIERIKYLSTEKGIASAAAGRALSLKKLITNPNRLSPNDLVDTAKEIKSNLKEDALIEVRSADQLELTLKSVAKERPDLMHTFMMAYDATDGRVHSITDLNDYIQNSTGFIRKLIIDKNTDIPSQFNAGIFGAGYNSALSSIETPLRAALGNMGGLVATPIQEMAGAVLGGNTQVLRRAWYKYSGIMSSMQQSFAYAADVFTKVAKNPENLEVVLRPDEIVRSKEQMEVIDSFIQKQVEIGNDGAAIVGENIKTMMQMNNNPVLRGSANLMTALDAFTTSMIRSAQVRGEAFDAATDFGRKKLDGYSMKRAKAMTRQGMKPGNFFDERGLVTDPEALYQGREIALSLPSKFANTLAGITEKAPVLKLLLPFPRTQFNALTSFKDNTPMMLLFKENRELLMLSDLAGKSGNLPGDKVKEILNSRGIPYTDANAQLKFETLVAKTRGQLAVGSVATGMITHYALSGNLRGDGHYDYEVQKVRDQNRYQRRTYRGIDGNWYSYDGMGWLSDLMAATATVVDNFSLMEQQDAEAIRGKIAFVFAQTIGQKSMFAGIKPLVEVFNGKPNVNAKAWANYLNLAIPMAGLRGDVGQMIDTAKREIDDDIAQALLRRNGGQGLPEQYNPITGEAAGRVDNPLARIYNATTPIFKVYSPPTPEEQFLIDIEFDWRLLLNQSEGKVEYTAAQRSEVQKRLGESGDWKNIIRKYMNNPTYKTFKEKFRAAKKASPGAKLEDFLSLHSNLRSELRAAQNYAESQLSDIGTIREEEYQIKRNEYGNKTGKLNFMDHYNGN